MWLRGRGDLRIHDNPLLLQAQRLNEPLFIMFTWSSADADKNYGFGEAQRVFLFSAVDALNRALNMRFQQVIHYVRLSDDAGLEEYLQLFHFLEASLSARTLLMARRYEPPLLQLDMELECTLTKQRKWKVYTHNMHLLHEPWTVAYDGDATSSAGHFGTLLPFWQAWQRNADLPPEPAAAPSTLPPAAALERCEPRTPACCEKPPPLAGDAFVDRTTRCAPFQFVTSLVETGLHPVRPGTKRWDTVLLGSWAVDEERVRAFLRDFLEHRLPLYEKNKSRADLEVVSRLSPYLALGMLSAREVFHATRAASRRLAASERSKTFERRLIWRDLAYWTLYMFPEAVTKPIRSHYASQEWNEDPRLLAAWQRGSTGYPIIDAGMRQLWQKGWMPQNIRMAAASFLVEYLNIHWIHGLQWFHRTLIDLDIAINAMMWQNAGRTGLDMWNFVIHPETSARSSDPTGAYVRKWLPELAQLPNAYIHAPWKAPESVLSSAGVQLGATYPQRIIADLGAARKQSQAAVLEMRSRSMPQFFNADGYDRIRVPVLKAVSLPHERFQQTATADNTVWRHVFTRREFREAPFATHLPHETEACDRQEAQLLPKDSTQAMRGNGDAQAAA